MREIFYTQEFAKRYQELPLAIQKKTERRERLFRLNPFHPSLCVEKLKPKGKECWSFRIDNVYRVIFKFDTNGRIIFLTCGHHHWIYDYLLNH